MENLIIGFSETEEVSLEGLPTVSPRDSPIAKPKKQMSTMVVWHKQQKEHHYDKF